MPPRPVPTPSPSPPPPPLEPRFSLPSATPLSSKTSIVIGGIRVYIYGLDDLEHRSDVEVIVLHLAHMRTRTYAVTEALAHEMLHRYRTDGKEKKFEMIALTIDMPNHGRREVSREANLTWKDGNEQHAQDLLSIICMAAFNFQLILDYLPSYLPQFNRLHNVMMGISLGGHMLYRLAASLPKGQVEAFAIVVGCPSLAPLLQDRLGMHQSTSSGFHCLERVCNRWPPALAKVVERDDQAVFDKYPTETPTMLCCGKLDPLVPNSYTTSWLQKRQSLGFDTSNMGLFVQENTGHSCTREMVCRIGTWLGDLYHV